MQQSQQRVFNVEEANMLVPFISNAFVEIFKLNEQARSLNIDINDLLGIWGEEVTDSGHVDYSIYSERVENRSKIYRSIQQLFDEISKTGVIVKDMDAGLVDFYAKKGDELIMLCWKFGEGRIKFWHPIQAGFSKRKSVDELKT